MNKPLIATLLATTIFVTACGGDKSDEREPAPAATDCAPSIVTEPKVVQIQEGLSSRVLTEGCGQVVAALGMSTTVHTTGYLFDAEQQGNRGEKFWSSYDGAGKPFIFQLGSGVIRGWNLGVPGMVEGEVRELTIAPELGYGESGSGPIPPNSTLVFEIEILELKGSVVEAAPAAE
jgi:FKBP-type peptidyl-prolyl cis-trans isomerase